MTAPSCPRRLVLSALILLPALGACTDSPTPSFYMLASRPAPPPTNSFSQTVVVKRIAVARYLDRPQIVRHSDPYGLTMSEFERWGEGLDDMATRVLVENLTQRLPGGQIYAATSPLTLPDADLTVEVNIDRFDADPGGTVVLAAQWVVHNSGRNAHFRSQQIRATESGDRAASQVAAMSDALGQLASDIAAALATQQPAQQPKRVSPPKAPPRQS